jgi:putative sterol carrier protein
MTEISIRKLMDKLPEAFVAERAGGVRAVVQFRLSGEGGGDWMVKFEDQTCHVAEGVTDQPDLTFSAEAQDCLDIFTGKMDGMRAFMLGRLKLTGDFSLALKLTSFFDMDKGSKAIYAQ